MSKEKHAKRKSYTGYIVSAVVGIILVGLFFAATASGSVLLSGKDFLTKFAATPNAVLLDVRTPAEFAAGHINGALNIDFEDASFESQIKKLNPNQTYFIYCRSGNRSGKAHTLMFNDGITHVYELSGGVISNTDSVKLQ